MYIGIMKILRFAMWSGTMSLIMTTKRTMAIIPLTLYLQWMDRKMSSRMCWWKNRKPMQCPEN